jgi:hypothetical protein
MSEICSAVVGNAVTPGAAQADDLDAALEELL